MKIGVLVSPTDPPIGVAAMAGRAEELGFDSFWVGEHPIMPVRTISPFPGSPDGIIPDSYSWFVDPFVALARASGVTKTIKLGTGVTLVPERNPLLLAKEVATLDYYSGGRFIFGIGAGWNEEETEIMGGDFSHRWTQTREAIEAMKELWTKDEAEYHGNYYDFPPVRSFPKPARKPYPPIFLGGTARSVFRRTVAYGDGWMPTRPTPELIKRGRDILREQASQAGRDPDSIQVLAYGVSADREALKDFERAGADAAVIRMAAASEKEGLDELERIGRHLLAGPGLA